MFTNEFTKNLIIWHFENMPGKIFYVSLIRVIKNNKNNKQKFTEILL